MRPFVASILFVGCVAGAPPDTGTGGSNSGSNSGSNGSGSNQAACALPASNPDTGNLSATAAQRCNVSGSMGAAHWYRLAAALPAGAMDFIQLELWDNTGPFVGTTVHTGTFTISGADADYATCGVCVRGLGDKGATDAKEYFAMSGTVNITAIGGNVQSVRTA